MNLNNILLDNQTPQEQAQTKKGTQALIYNSMTIEEKLRHNLKHHIEQLNTTPNKIKEGKVKNPFPIGTRSVYVFACGGEISDSHKWKLLEFFAT